MEARPTDFPNPRLLELPSTGSARRLEHAWIHDRFYDRAISRRLRNSGVTTGI